MHVAGIRRIEQDQPRNVAVIFLTVGTRSLGAAQERLVAQVQQRHLGKMRIGLRDDAVDIIEPAVVRILDRLFDAVHDAGTDLSTEELLGNIYETQINFCPAFIILFVKIIYQTGKHNIHGFPFGSVCHVFL